MKIMITGATGYIGHKLALEAAARDFTVHILVRNVQSALLPIHPNIIPFKGDINDKETVVQSMQGCEMVMHTAAITKLWDKDSSIFYKVNVDGTRNVLDAALETGVQKFVFTSSAAVIGPSDKFPMRECDPRITAFENDYEISKHLAEELVREYCRKGLFAVIVAAPRVYGPGISTGGNAIEKLFKQIISMRMAFAPSCGKVLGNYGFIDDIVTGHFLALEKGISSEKYILGGENLSYDSFFKKITKNSGIKVRIIRVPVSIIKCWSFFYMLFFRILGKHTNISPKNVSRFAQNRALSCEKAIRQLGYKITPFNYGIQKTFHHLNQLHQLGKNKNYA